MKFKKIKAVAAAMAAVLLLSSVPAVFADAAGASKGAGIIGAAMSASQEEAESETQTARDSGSEDAGASQAAEEPDIELGDDFSTDLTAEEEAALDSIEYSLDEYENNEVLIMYTDGSLEVQSYDSQEKLAAGLEELEADPDVDTYQPNFSYENEAVTADMAAVADALTDDTYSYEQWALSNDGSFEGYRTKVNAKSGVDVDAEKAWEYYTPARETVVALIDTGVQYTHTELTGSFWTNTDEIAGNGIDDDGNGYIDDVNGWNFYDNNSNLYSGTTDAHGTHGAGTISADKDNKEGISGLADYDNIKIMMLKALGGENGEGTTLSLSLAIKYAEANGASICNLSLGTDTNDRVLYRTIKNSNMLFVVASGNGGSDGKGTDIDRTPSYPASYDLDNIITVANIQADGNLSESSDYGRVSVDLAAPGTDILSTSTNDKYAFMTGTSMAAPFVTATAALVYSSNAALTLADTRNIILSTVKKDTALEGKTATGGILDCGSAVAYAVTGSTQRDAGDDSIEPEPSQQGQQQPGSNGGQNAGMQPDGNHSFTDDPFANGFFGHESFSNNLLNNISIPTIDFNEFFGFHFKVGVPGFLQLFL